MAASKSYYQILQLNDKSEPMLCDLSYHLFPTRTSIELVLKSEFKENKFINIKFDKETTVCNVILTSRNNITIRLSFMILMLTRLDASHSDLSLTKKPKH